MIIDTIEQEVENLKIHFKKIPEDLATLTANATNEDLQIISDVKSPSRCAEILTTLSLIRSALGKNAKLEHNLDGSPYIKNNNLNISISHCKGMVAIATHPHMHIGIDIERWRNTLLKVQSKFLSDAEIRFYNSSQLLLNAWTAKEAIYKAAGYQGLDFAKGIELPLRHNENIATAHLPGKDLQFTLHTSISGEITTTVAVPVTIL